MDPRPTIILPRARLGELFEAIVARGYRVIAPKLDDGAIAYAEIRDVAELPVGITDEQGPGRYRTRPRADGAVFGYAAGPRSFRDFFQPPRQTLVKLRRKGDAELSVEPEAALASRPLALFGARSCDLAAIAAQDRILLHGAYPDVRYAARRQGALIIAVNCTEPSSVCFCASMGTGPRVNAAYDIALTELLDEHEHRFALQVGSERGAELVHGLSLAAASRPDLSAELAAVDSARLRMGRALSESGVREALLANLDHPRWDQVADRCLSCTNCTLVCPTCFCTTTEDSIDVTGEHAERQQRHDSCFSREYSYVHGGSVRGSIKARYRQWLTHKFATWYDQFGSSGCVGCGRCISQCPVGIDVTEEIAAIRSNDHAD